MINGPALGVILAIALTWYAGHEAVAGVRWVVHHVKPAIHKVLHPHEEKK